MQELRQYFKQTKGNGVLITSGKEGKVDAIVYPKPIIDQNDYVVFVTQDPIAYQNLSHNPRAMFVFMEYFQPNQGVRLELIKSHEENESAVQYSMESQKFSTKKQNVKHILSFQLQNKLPLYERGDEELGNNSKDK